MPRPDKHRAAKSPSSASSSRGHKKSAQQPPQQHQPKRPSCLVCKFRRVKCDGARPTCGQCKQVKRACPGYPDDPRQGSAARTTTPALSQSESTSSFADSPSVVVSGPEGEDEDFDEEFESKAALALRTPPRTPDPSSMKGKAPQAPSISELSASAPVAIDFSSAPLLPFYQRPELSTPEDPLVHMYRHRTIPELHPLASDGMVGEWRSYILQAADADVTLRYVASALATYHDNFLSASTASGILAAKYYSKGLASMTASFDRTSQDPDSLVHLMMSASVLLGVEYFRRNFSAIRIHLESIIKVLGARPNSDMIPSLTVAEQFFRRTYLYFSFFPSLYPTFNTITRVDVPHRSNIPHTQPTSFTSLGEADQALHDILWPWMFFSQALERNQKLRSHPAAAEERDALLRALATWSKAFEAFVTATYASLPEQSQILVDTFILWTTMIQLRTLHSLSSGENRWDQHLQLFKSMLVRAASIDDRTVRRTKISLEPVLGIQTPLFFVVSKCRDPATRREALSLLNGARVTHAQWFPPATARVGLRVVELEEDGWEKRFEEDRRVEQERERSVGSPGSTVSLGSSSGGLRAGHLEEHRPASVGSTGGGRAGPSNPAKVSSPAEGKRVTDSHGIAEEDRARDLRFHVDVKTGMVEIGYFCWYGSEIGWKERREALSLAGMSR